MQSKNIKNLLKRVTSVAMAGALVLSMGIPAKAANADPNLVVEANTKYSTQIEAGKSVTLGLMPADSYYYRTGFESAEAAATGLKVDSISVGSDKITGVYSYGSMETTDKNGDATWAGTVTVTGAEGQHGPTSLHIINNNNTSAYIDMTVYVEAAETQDDVTVASVEAVDLRDGGTTYEYGEGLTVEAAVKESANPFKGSIGAAQSYPTAGDALYSLAAANGLSFAHNEGYVETLTDSNGTELHWYMTEDWTNYGWNYCVVRDGEKVVEGEIVSASVLEVKDGDAVYWAFGTEDQAKEYFALLTE